MKNSVQLHEIGQSFWLDSIDRRALVNGEMQRLVDEGVIWGVTSNPSIFQKAITSSNVYRSQIQAMSLAGLNAEKIYENLIIQDIRETADILLPVYEKTGGKDGYVSLEVNPDLAFKEEETVEEAERLWKLVNRPNLMIKIPATNEGIFAIRESIAKGININITLIFSVKRYGHVIDAYLSGLEQRLGDGKDISSIHSVASFFVSRMDVKVDKILEGMSNGSSKKAEEAQQLMGKTGIDNALTAYRDFLESIESDRFAFIQSKEGNIQRPLWASTSTKNPEYSDILYVKGLMLPNTVNTLPMETLNAFLDHGQVKTIDFEKELKQAEHNLVTLESINVDLERLTDELEQEGVEKFSISQEHLLIELENMRADFMGKIDDFSESLKNQIAQLQKEDFVNRLCTHDVTLWPAEEKGKAEIAIRMDWLEAPITSREIIQPAETLLGELLDEGFTHAVVLGMGGSSLAPEVYGELAKGFGVTKGLELSILDTTSPEQILAKRNEIPLEKTIFIVSSKSGTTSETLSLFHYFWNEIKKADIENPGEYFVAITDPETKLETLAKEKGFRKIFRANANVGGRYSALIEFGLVPAILAGIDAGNLLRSAQNMMPDCSKDDGQITNAGVILGALMGAAYMTGRDKLTIVSDKLLSPIGAWIEQLVAESSGKQGKGILPVADEPIVDAGEYGEDRFFVYLKSNGENQKLVDSLIELAHPVLTMKLEDINDLGAEFYQWETAIATACSIIGVDAFDQPNVQLSKTITKEMIADYQENKAIRENDPIFSDDQLAIYADHMDISQADDAAAILREFVGLAGDKSFVAINAFVARNDHNNELLQSFRKRLLESTGLATTLGFGPRFLHSTGQLHKGGKNIGLFIVISKEPAVDVDIPEEGMTFGVLLKAQAIGDTRALQQQNRRVMRVFFKQKSLEETYLNELLMG